MASTDLRSTRVTRGARQAPARAYLRAVGMTDADFGRPQVGIANSWNELTPCNLPLRGLAEAAKQGVRAGGAFPMEFGTVTVSDGVAMGHEGMRASLVSREVIADSVEAVPGHRAGLRRRGGRDGLCPAAPCASR